MRRVGGWETEDRGGEEAGRGEESSRGSSFLFLWNSAFVPVVWVAGRFPLPLAPHQGLAQ